MVARYIGKGDVNAAASFEPVKPSVQVPQLFNNQIHLRLLGPDNQKFYQAINDELVVVEAQ
jgi:glutaredoxin